MVIHAEINIPLWLAPFKSGYKYVVKNKSKYPYEEIVEYRSSFKGHVNRCLVIDKQYITENGKLII